MTGGRTVANLKRSPNPLPRPPPAPGPVRSPRADADAKLFQGKAYQAKRDYLQRLEVQMWDSEPAPAGGPASTLRRWIAPLAGVALVGAMLWGRGREQAAATAPAGAGTMPCAIVGHRDARQPFIDRRPLVPCRRQAFRFRRGAR